MRRALFAFATIAWCAQSAFATPPQFLKQNWSDTDRQWFYTTPQGSKLIPYGWALALERAGSEQRFFTNGNLARLGYLPNAKSNTNPDALPVGFVKDTANAGNDLGLTCAACHTSQLDYKGVTYQIDGAPANSDLFALLKEISESLLATQGDGPANPKFLRFAGRVLKGGNSAPARSELYAKLQAFTRDFADFVANTTPATEWGRARIDAFGAIFNRVTAIDLNIPANNRPPNAPVSVPFLWDTSWHDVVQWNGSAPNKLAVLRLARNVGEVLGVFANVTITTPTLDHLYYESTAKRINLLEIEDRLATLRSPRWPAPFPAIDAAKAARGQAIYNEQCLSCHIIETPGQAQTVTLTPLSDVGTDPVMTTDAAARQAQTGVLQGVKSVILFGDPFGPAASAGSITFNAVVGSILSPIPSDWFKGAPAATKTAKASTSTRTGAGSEHDLRTDLFSAAHDIATKVQHDAAKVAAADPVKADLEAALKTLTPPPGLVYKGRPLDGIWATAPYLHNGSVPTLRDLLLPVDSRPKTFYAGSRAFDPDNVGFSTTEGPGLFLFDTSKPGNSNSGHVYGTTLSEEDRQALIEYLKSL